MTSSLDSEAVRHVAHLSRLKVSDEEVARYAVQLSTVLAYFEQLNELDTTQIEPTAHPGSVHNVFREDTVGPSLDPDHALSNAPDRQDTFFRVPKVFDQENA